MFLCSICKASLFESPVSHCYAFTSPFYVFVNMSFTIMNISLHNECVKLMKIVPAYVLGTGTRSYKTKDYHTSAQPAALLNDMSNSTRLFFHDHSLKL